MSTEEWFEQLKQIGKKYGFAANNAEFKEWWYIWKVWDLAMFLRLALCASKRTPDLFSVMKVMWKERVSSRLQGVIRIE
jgi:glutamyl-tRNA synthetase